MSRSRFLHASAVALLALATPVIAATPAAKPELGTFGFDTTGMDRSVAPGADWVRFTNGHYNSTVEIPADRTSYGMFTKLRDLSQERTRAIIEATAKKSSEAGSNAQKVGDYYASYMDEAGIEAKGIAPVKPMLDGIAAINDRSALATQIGVLGRDGVDMPIGSQIIGDLKNPDVLGTYIGQGGLGLPDRDYYLDDNNPKFVEARGKYVEHMAKMLTLAGFTDAPARAQAVYDLEKKLATAQWSKVEQRQMDKIYNPVARTAVDAAYPGVDWTGFLTAQGLSAQPQLIVTEPSAVKGTAALIASEPLNVWKDYMAYHTLSAFAPYLPKAFVDENFAFDGTVLGGQPQIAPRWKRASDSTAAVLGEAVGSLYVAEYFPPESKAKADELVKNIIAAMDGRLQKLEWMDPKTREQARAKLAAFTPKIGYPDKWQDYSKFEVVRGDALGNALRSRRYEYQRQLDKIGKPIDRSEWGMTPMTVNAYANPLWNEIVFPAAILQPPFFDAKADDAVNYGGIGMVIGHEISHHFDDQGRKFDKFGKLAEWWTPEDVTRFKALTDKVVKQYAAYEPLKGSHVNGELTLGENMADLAGITIAYDAWQRSLNGKTPPVIDGFTGEQRFFLGAAQVWRQRYRDATLLRQLTTDPHTPGMLRPNVARNLDAWYKAFDVKPGQADYLTPADRAKVW